MKYRGWMVLVVLYIFLLGVKFDFVSIKSAYVRNYFADILCLPILLSVSTLLIRYVKRAATFKLSILQICFVFLYISIVFEFVLPHFSTKFTYDIFDIFAYGLGGIIFYFFQDQLIEYIFVGRNWLIR